MKKFFYSLALVMGFTLTPAVSQVLNSGNDVLKDRGKTPASLTEAPLSLEVDVPTAGLLSNVLPAEQATSVVNLKITGYLNSTDINYLRSYTPFLASLDMSEAIYNSTTFPSSAFSDKSSLVRVKMPKQITSINYNAFYNCSSLKRIVLPDSLRTISSYVFQKCLLLDSVVLPAKTNSLGYQAFESCTALQSIAFPKGLTSMSNYVFQNCTGLKSVVLSDTLTALGEGIFYNCSSLKNVHLPAKLTSISYYTFYQCTSLDSIAFPISLTSLGHQSFAFCSSLKSVLLPNNLNNLNTYAFQDCRALERVILPANLETIGSYTFYNCTKLKNLKLPDNLTSIASGAFNNCNALQKLKIPGYVQSIGDNAFQNCSQLDSLIFPATLTDIYSYAFKGCSSLKMVKLPNAMLILREGIFQDCIALDSVAFPVGMTQIGHYVFQNCNSLKGKLILPATLTSIGYYAFYNCGYTSCKSLATTPPSLYYTNTSLGNIRIAYVPVDAVSSYKTAWPEFLVIGGDTLTSVNVTLAAAGTLGEAILEHVSYVKDVHKLTVSGPMNGTDLSLIQNMPSLISLNLKNARFTAIPDYQFSEKYLYTDIVLPDSLKTIGYQAFYNCRSLTGIRIPEKVTSLPEYCFYGCYNLMDVELLEGLTNIGNYAFYNCSSLENIVLPQTLENINQQAFYNCAKLKSIVIPPKVTVINSNTFAYCGSLQNVTLPEKMTSIASSAFYECGLTNLTLPDNITSIDDYAFYSNNIKKLVLPAKLTTLHYYSFAYNPIDSLTLPASLNSIETYAFYNCTSLKDIRCLQPTPPVLTNDPFGEVDKSKCSLTLPFWNANMYKAAYIWSLFYPVYTYSTEIKDIPVSGDLIFANNIRPLGKPNVKVLGNGSLTVRGDAPMNNDRFTLNASLTYDYGWWYGYTHYINFGKLVSECPNMTADQVNLSLFIDGGLWYYLTFPFDVKVDSLSIGNSSQFVFRKYDGANRATNGSGDSWKTMTRDSVLKAGEGYIYQSSLDALLNVVPTEATKNKLFASTAQTFSLKEHPSTSLADKSWNFIGNPYPTYYDISEIDYTAPITVWNLSNMTYQALSLADDDYILRPFEAFFVQKPADVAQITFKPQGRQTISTKIQGILKSPARLRSSADRKLINLSIGNESYQDKCRIVINPNASLSYELQSDASKFMSSMPQVPQLYSIDEKGIKYAINERPLESGTIRLGCYIGAAGKYTIAVGSLAEDADQVVLNDKLLQIQTTLNDESYEFTSAVGTFDKRFELSVQKIPTNSESVNENSDKVWATDGMLNIRTKAGNKVSIFVMNGILLREMIATEDLIQLTVDKGAYLVKIEGKTYKSVVF